MLQVFSELFILQIIHITHTHTHICVCVCVCMYVRACYGRPVHSNNVERVPFSHGVVHSHVAGVGDGLRIWNVDVKILNKQSRTTNRGVVFQFRRCAVKSHSYLFTPWCRVLLEKLTGLQLVKKFPRISRNPKVHCCTHKRPQPVPILGQPSSVHIPTSHLMEMHPNIIHPSTPRSPQWALSLRFPHQDPMHPLSTSTWAKCLWGWVGYRQAKKSQIARYWSNTGRTD